MQKFTTTLCLLFTFGLVLPYVYAAKVVEIGAGSAHGEYSQTIVPAIDKELQQHGYSAKVIHSAGSQENIDNILAGKLMVGLAQLDVAVLNMKNDLDNTLVLLGDKIAPEALFCAVHKKSKVKKYADLTHPETKPIKISLGQRKSGTARTFQYLMTLDSELKEENFDFHHDDTQKALNQLNSHALDIVCFIINPNPDNDLIKQVADNENLMFIEINQPHFAVVEINGFSIYNILDVPYAKESYWCVTGEYCLRQKDKTIKTLVTWVHLIGNHKQIDSKLESLLTQIVNKDDLLPSDSVVGKAKAMICDAFPKLCE
jgi:TRAP-type uncharacterized transport system substrate-binding protein